MAEHGNAVSPPASAHLNRMTPSGLNDFQGCKLISTIRSVVSDRSRKEGCRFAKSRYACDSV